MRSTTIDSRELSDCWSAHRYCEGCHLCKRVQRCPLPEANKGRIRVLDDRIEGTTKHLEKLYERRKALTDV